MFMTPAHHHQLYDITQSIEANVMYGPSWSGTLPKLLEKGQPRHQLFGLPLRSPFGVPACPLTVNARAVFMLAELGFDLITYKSVRSVEFHGNVYPHWRYVNVSDQLFPGRVPTELTAADQPFHNQDATMANSFGVQSVRPEFWQADVDATVGQLPEGKQLILSLMCTPQKGETLVDDAKRLGKLAAQTHAKVFELNLACPNTDGGAGLIFEDVKRSHALCEAVKNELRDRPLLVKVGLFSKNAMIAEFLQAVHQCVEGVTTTNTLPAQIVNTDGTHTFPGRPSAGVSGAGIRDAAMAQYRAVAQHKAALQLDDFAVIACGGVTKPEHISTYLGLGATAVQAAVGVLANPLLAYQYKHTVKDT
jgi:dihydroorotate dehydrogenase